MATKHQELPRLNIPLNFQQPIAFDNRQNIYSPALPTPLHNVHHQYPMSSMQTPMQSFFNVIQPPNISGRPNHRAHPSLGHFPGGMPSSARGPVTPVLTGHFPHPSLVMGPNMQHGFPPRNRRQLSIGGPPKAVLGGPGRKLSPLPPPVATPPPAAPPVKSKKVLVNLPQETVLGTNEDSATRPDWARTPLHPSLLPNQKDMPPPEIHAGESFPPDSWRYHIPDTVDVFLPGKIAWDAMKQQVIEEKLEKLGVERGSGAPIPHIYAPHARAASISSPADPGLLYFKLNKLHQAQTVSSTSSLSTSPQPPFNLSPSPNQMPPRFQTNRHGHSMSLAPPQTLQHHNSVAAFNPFGPGATLGSDQIMPRRLSPGPVSAPLEGIFAPQGRIPVKVASLAPPLPASRPDSRPDFTRGFGLDIPEEEEPEEDVPMRASNSQEGISTTDRADMSQETSLESPEGDMNEFEEASTAAQSRLHSRHVSKLSASLSLRSVGGHGIIRLGEDMVPLRSPIGEADVDDLDQDAVGEWTGSEDLRMSAETSEDESIGEWSNPSDEERARQHRVNRRLLRRAQQETEQPRKLPNFPRPPENTITLPLCKEDDIISNPSEEGLGTTQPPGGYMAIDSQDYFARQDSNPHSRSPRPLPPLPHSRMPSGQSTSHDPTQAHSRAASDREYPAPHQQRPSMGRRDSLNPFAKPFVFGATHQSGSWTVGSFGDSSSLPTSASFLGHSRMPSLGKPLNATAQEFKPGGFNFRPPPGVPQMAFPVPEAARSLSVAPVISPTARPQQGREKRQRRASSASTEGANDNMSSFKFPATGMSPTSTRRTAPTTPRLENKRQSSLSASAEPFTFSGLSNASPFIPQRTLPLPRSLTAYEDQAEYSMQDESTVKAQNADHSAPEAESQEIIIPTSAKQKRAPIPLDFKHPVSSNTIPAGLFKALVTDERTRRTVRSRLGSREFRDHMPRPSLDDLHVPPISQRISRSRLAADPGLREPSQDLDDFFGPESKRRSSMPSTLHGSAESSDSAASRPALNLTGRFELQEHERRLEALLDEKIRGIRRELSHQKQSPNGQPIQPSTEAMIQEVVSLFRSQLHESAARGLEECQMDARGEMDFELIKGMIHEGNAESQALLQHELRDAVERLGRMSGQFPSQDLKAFTEQLNNRTVSTIVDATARLSDRVESLRRINPAVERHAMIEEIMQELTPLLSSLRTDPIDYDLLTAQLTQAVKPHISQLIDLASDKRETAGLIVDRILPLLPSSKSLAPPFDATALIAQIITEIRRAIAPIDAFEIKEQVADLVVERLDSRLAIRDRTFNIDTVSSKVRESVAELLEPLHHASSTLETMVESHQVLSTQTAIHSLAQNEVMTLLKNVLTTIVTLKDDVNAVRDELHSQPEPSSPNHQQALDIKKLVDDLAIGQKALSSDNNELLSVQKTVLERLSTLPDHLSAATSALQNAQAHRELWNESVKRELDELRKSNTDMQVQLAKARGAHGQVRVEKDMLSEKVGRIEGDRDQLRFQVKEMQASGTAMASEVSSFKTRNAELEEALAQALARLQASDVVSQSTQERIVDLEKTTSQLEFEKQALSAQVDALELDVARSARDRDTATQSLTALQSQYEHVQSQQIQWNDIHRASEKIESLISLIGQANNEEATELRSIRDRSKALESDYTTLQKRFKDQESKIANNEKALVTLRQSLAQAQQRASEWERRTKESEGKVEMLQTQLDHSEQAHAQLEADHSLAVMQLEEQQAGDRLLQDREGKLQDKINTLERKLARSQADSDRAGPTLAYHKAANGHSHASTINHSSRPESRASTIYGDDHPRTPIQHTNGRLASRDSSIRSAKPSVWDSMHAPSSATSLYSSTVQTPPKTHTPNGYLPSSTRAPINRYPAPGPTTPKARRTPHHQHLSIPSPTPSTVSLAPTQGEDGWWA